MLCKRPAAFGRPAPGPKFHGREPKRFSSSNLNSTGTIPTWWSKTALWSVPGTRSTKRLEGRDIELRGHLG